MIFRSGKRAFCCKLSVACSAYFIQSFGKMIGNVKTVEGNQFSGSIEVLLHRTESIEESEIFPEWNTYYYIDFKSGSGIESRGWTLHNTAKGNIKEAIENSIEMYEHSMIDGFSTLADVEESLKIAYRTYEAYSL